MKGARPFALASSRRLARSASNSARSASLSRPAGAALAASLARRRPRARRRVVAQLQRALAAQHLGGIAGEAHAAVAVDVDLEKTARHELAEHRLPGAPVEVGADAEGRQPVVAGARHALVGLAEQQVDQVALAEALAGAPHRRERLLGRDRAVPGPGRLEAGVAVAAGLGQRLAEILQEDLAAAARGLAVARAARSACDARPGGAPRSRPTAMNWRCWATSARPQVIIATAGRPSRPARPVSW